MGGSLAALASLRGLPQRSAFVLPTLPPPLPRRRLSHTSSTGATAHTAYIGLGSNLGDRRANLQQAVSLLRQLPLTSLQRASFLYETEPQLLTQQPRFLNAAAAISTSLPPQELLSRLKLIEQQLGRPVGREAQRYGPRVLDLDILLYGDAQLQTASLSLPHPLLASRLFVLAPLADIVDAQHEHPTLRASIHSLRDQLQLTQAAASSSVCRVLALGSRLFPHGERTLVMGIVNCTPDSFSDGSEQMATRPEAAVQQAERRLGEGADLLDIGGESTRPGAQPVPVEEELRRVLPVVRALHAAHPDVPLSIDTRNAQTAVEAVRAGAALVNDVSGGLHDQRMLQAVAELGVPYVCSHTRGSPQTMSELSEYGDVLQEVRAELTQRVQAALQAGVCSWNIIVDPGLGFAKTAQQNVRHTAAARSWRQRRCPALSLRLTLSRAVALCRPVRLQFSLLRRLSTVCPPASFPVLIGASRKSFITRAVSGQTADTEPRCLSAQRG